jgi:hypothetical protein
VRGSACGLLGILWKEGSGSDNAFAMNDALLTEFLEHHKDRVQETACFSVEQMRHQK